MRFKAFDALRLLVLLGFQKKHTFDQNSYDLPQTHKKKQTHLRWFASANVPRCLWFSHKQAGGTPRWACSYSGTKWSACTYLIQGSRDDSANPFSAGDHRRADTLEICLPHMDYTTSNKHTPLHNQTLPCYYWFPRLPGAAAGTWRRGDVETWRRGRWFQDFLKPNCSSGTL